MIIIIIIINIYYVCCVPGFIYISILSAVYCSACILYIYVCNCAYDIDGDDDAEDRQKRVVYRPSYKKLGPTIDREQTANSQKRTQTDTEYYYN